MCVCVHVGENVVIPLIDTLIQSCSICILHLYLFYESFTASTCYMTRDTKGQPHKNLIYDLRFKCKALIGANNKTFMHNWIIPIDK